MTYNIYVDVHTGTTTTSSTPETFDIISFLMASDCLTAERMIWQVQRFKRGDAASMVTVGYKANTPADAGSFYCPYILLQFSKCSTTT